MKTKHTQGPLRVSQGGNFIQLCIPGTIKNICEMSPLNGDGDGHDTEPFPSPSVLMEARAKRKADAERLVHCWNCHDDLLSALQSFVDDESLRACGSPKELRFNTPGWLSRMAKARAAIAKAQSTP